MKSQIKAISNAEIADLDPIEDVEARIEGLEAIRDALNHLINNCRDDDRPEYPNLDRDGRNKAITHQ